MVTIDFANGGKNQGLKPAMSKVRLEGCLTTEACLLNAVVRK
jgi:hypothetical protein